ncbi:hypothetical protein H072_10725 [Dactylellina haptotyla CBS 200.50]|uniref:Cyanovirin-N domain-containing protein n=1 Tax=Dactylellina haptotyla (strain CBS 200.50) TaxID=1284197 RepID=S7ZZ92_DACHA|nr:hypothetical protein H072_10725 [Dactylellina haptotyla CBS 200.50]
MKVAFIVALIGFCGFSGAADNVVSDNPKQDLNSIPGLYSITALIHPDYKKFTLDDNGVLTITSVIPKVWSNREAGYVEFSINLDEQIGINGQNGEFDLTPGARGLKDRSVFHRVEIENGRPIFKGQLRPNVFGGKEISANLTHHLFFTGTNEKNLRLFFRKTSDNIARSGSNFNLVISRAADGAITAMNYSCYLEDLKGQLQPASFDLLQIPNLNKEAYLLATPPNKYYLQPMLSIDPLIIQFPPLDHNLGDTMTIGLEDVLANENGKLVLRQPTDMFFSRDGVITTFAEGLPFFGYLVAFMHDVSGNTAQRDRALAKATYASVVAIVGTLGTIAAAPFGIALLTAAATAGGTVVGTGWGLVLQDTIRQKIPNSQTQAEIDDLTWTTFTKEAIINVLTGGSFGLLADGVGNKVTSSMLVNVNTQMGRYSQQVGAFLVDQGIDKTAGSVYVGMTAELSKTTLDTSIKMWNYAHQDKPNKEELNGMLNPADLTAWKGQKQISAVHEVTPDSHTDADVLELAKDDPTKSKKAKGNGKAKGKNNSKGKGKNKAIDKSVKEGETTLDVTAALAAETPAASTMATKKKAGKKTKTNGAKKGKKTSTATAN